MFTINTDKQWARSAMWVSLFEGDIMQIIVGLDQNREKWI